jgi:hypothetical protein
VRARDGKIVRPARRSIVDCIIVSCAAGNIAWLRVSGGDLSWWDDGKMSSCEF